ncbi:MAG: phenylalanine--tRNA ligase subunit beta [Cyclobacteriaceae bacterium]|nr:phenylalanine--tRNA ligase subunit beta [Cyclobacteriaceae bacterium]
MKISLNWLKQYIDITETPDQLAHLLTMTGLEVEGFEVLETIKGGLKGLVIGEVLECAKHPNADKLSVTKVDVGAGNVLPIVCGAPNVAVGQKVVVATVGTTLYPSGSNEGFTIKQAKIRGEVSEGMICAEDEIGIGTSHDGIMILDTNLPNGTPANEHFHIENDVVFEIGLTPNRGDAASHIGIARDLRAVLNRDISWPDISGFKADNQSSKTMVTVEEAAGCPRYSGLSISNVTISESPEWLKNRLLSIGQTPINNVVDVTNFILHELGQPLHSFDADKIHGDHVIVKTLSQGTPFVTLDGKERKLNSSDLMICDVSGGMCIAGVFGGIDSGISDKTKNIFLESAYFSPDYVRKTSQTHALKTDSAFRFERGTDPWKTVYALKRAALLIREVAGGEISSDIIDIYPHEIMPVRIPMKFQNIHRLIGKKLSDTEIYDILGRLDIECVDRDDSGFLAVVPPYRYDVTRPADVVEEILRIYGYENVELKNHIGSDFMADFPEVTIENNQLKASGLLVDNGFFEISTNSLSQAAYTLNTTGFNAAENVEILNKLSEDLGVLRQTLLFTGLEVVAHNLNRKQLNLRLFEFGKEYKKSSGKYTEKDVLALWMAGEDHRESWMAKSRPLEFHDLSTIVLKLISKFTRGKIKTSAISDPAFTYGLGFSIEGHEVAKAGLLQKKICSAVDIDAFVFYAEIDFNGLLLHTKDRLNVEEISKFPEVRRDLSLVLDKKVSFEQVREVAEDGEFSSLLVDINVFDYYVGEKIEKDKKAYALSFILQDKTKTLTDNIIDKIMQRMMEKFESKLGAVIRQ